jgi:hypothetical protein
MTRFSLTRISTAITSPFVITPNIINNQLVQPPFYFLSVHETHGMVILCVEMQDRLVFNINVPTFCSDTEFTELQQMIHELKEKDNSNETEPHMQIAFTMQTPTIQLTLPCVSVESREQFSNALQYLYDLMCELQ